MNTLEGIQSIMRLRKVVQLTPAAQAIIEEFKDALFVEGEDLEFNIQAKLCKGPVPPANLSKRGLQPVPLTHILQLPTMLKEALNDPECEYDFPKMVKIFGEQLLNGKCFVVRKNKKGNIFLDVKPCAVVSHVPTIYAKAVA